MRVDLNADLGERPGALAEDDRLMALVTSANVACGAHAGDAATMEATVRSALRRGVAVGAHPGLPDRAGFGRAAAPVAPERIEALVAEQVRALGRIAAGLGAPLVHLKPHGALYHLMDDPAAAEALARGAGAWSRDLVLVGRAGSPALVVWADLGFAVAAEGFVDRGYGPGGRLVPRGEPGALIGDPAAAAAQALRLAPGVDTLCVHGDSPGAEAIARAVRGALEGAGVEVGPLRGRRRPSSPPPTNPGPGSPARRR